MRSRGIQGVLLVIVFGAIIAGLTFARQWMASPPPQAPTKVDPKTTQSFITFGGPTLSGLNYEMKPARGYQDLWFENAKDQDIELGLEQTSCKCAGVAVTLLTEKESDKLRNWLPVAAATQWAAGSGGFLAQAGPAFLCLDRVRDIFQDSSRWKHMLHTQEVAFEPFLVPPKATGLLRVEWEGRKLGPERIGAMVWTQPARKELQRVYIGLEIPLVFVSPLMATPSQAEVDLGSGDRKTASFWCWSATRAGFQLSAREESSHPCFSCTCVPLVGQEYERALQATKAGQTPPSVLFGYRVVVTVAERVDSGAQLDLGHFSRKIILTSQDLEFFPGVHEHIVSLQGNVQGEVSVGSPTDHDRVNLGIYAKTRGTTKEIPVETLKPGLKLKPLEHTPPFLAVQLKEEKTTLEGVRYRMTVTVPKNQSYLPEDSAIVLETMDNPPRKVRIPVAGTATIPLH